MNRALLLVLVLLTMSSCGRKFTDIFSRNNNRLVVNQVKFDYASSKAKIDYTGDGKSISATANVRIQKDSVIWISLSPGLGVEVARAMITRDSVFFLDKMNKEFWMMDFDSLSRMLDFEVNYSFLESVVLGNLIYPYEQQKVTRTTENLVYTQQQGGFNFENFIGLKSMKLEKVVARDTASRNTISVNYSAFQLVEDQIFPFQILATIGYQESSGREATKIEIAFKQTQLEKKPLKFPFNVPQRFERK